MYFPNLSLNPLSTQLVTQATNLPCRGRPYCTAIEFEPAARNNKLYYYRMTCAQQPGAAAGCATSNPNQWGCDPYRKFLALSLARRCREALYVFVCSDVFLYTSRCYQENPYYKFLCGFTLVLPRGSFVFVCPDPYRRFDCTFRTDVTKRHFFMCPNPY